MTNHPDKIPVGVSSCLLGQLVRYDGGHRHNTYISNTLGQYFKFVPFCPEVESGMGTPRPPVQLRDIENKIRCVGVKDKSLDVTDQLIDCASKQNKWLQGLCGYILKRGSPSCGMERVKIYKNNSYDQVGTGLFAQYLQQHFPLLPLVEEGTLGDPQLRENFVLRVFILQRWKQLIENQLTPQKLATFHSQHQLIIMSHNQSDAQTLDNIVVNATSYNLKKVSEHYGLILMSCLKKIASRDNHAYVLQHIQGYLKIQLDGKNKTELIETIEHYRLGNLPLIVPITLLRHHFHKAPVPFIDRSLYMKPFPDDLS